MQANKWGAAQEAAVASAGGKVRYASADAGVAVVDSDNPDFLAAMGASRTVLSTVADATLEFKQPNVALELQEDAVNPGIETFWNAQWAPRAIDAPGAWNAGFTGAGVRVAVIDCGIHSTHIDLAGQIDTAHSTSFVRAGLRDGLQHTSGRSGCTHLEKSSQSSGIGTIGMQRHGDHHAATQSSWPGRHHQHELGAVFARPPRCVGAHERAQPRGEFHDRADRS